MGESGCERGLVGAAVRVVGLVALLCAACGPKASEGVTLDTSTPPMATRAAVVKLVLSDLRVRDETPPEVRPAGVADMVEAQVRGGFFGDEAFEREAVGDALTCRGGATVGYTLIKNRMPDPTAEVGEARVILESELQCSDGGKEKLTFRVSLDDSASFGGPGEDDGRKAIATLLASLSRRAGAVLHGQIRMREATDAEVLAALATSSHEGILAEAASEAGERKLQGAIADLVRLTADARDLVSIRAGAALGLLRARGEEAVRALARMTDGPNEEKHIVAVNALGDIGGEAAVRYLRSMAESLPNPALRELARAAVARQPEEPSKP